MESRCVACHTCGMQQAVPPLIDAYTMFQAGRVPEALKLFQHHADRGDAEALFTLGDIYWRGAGVEQDISRGRELIRRSGDAGHPMGIRAYTNLLASGIGGERDWPAALKRLALEAQSDLLRRRMFDLVQAMTLTPSGEPVAVPEPERLSDRLDMRIFRCAFSAAECNFLIMLAEPTYERSLVVMDGRNVPDPIRTSDGSTFHWLIEDPATHAINRRIAALSGTSVEQGEPLHVLRYRPGQQYHPHTDWLPPPNRRMMTTLIYLNEDYEDGETAFPKAGLKVRGRKGDALVFTSALPNGDLDPLSEHAGLPIINGTKYLASRWIREGRNTP
jgi:prolyl 4-hydroxylase